MNMVKAFPYEGKIAVTTGFGWDPGPDIDSLPKAQQESAKATWPRFHRAVDLALLDKVIDQLGFSFYQFPILAPIDAISAEYVAKDDWGVSNLRLIGSFYEVRIKHMILGELSRDILAIMDAKRSVPAGVRLGPTGNVGLSFGGPPAYGRHLHYSFIAWGHDGEDFLREKLGSSWNVDIAPDLIKEFGDPVILIMGKSGIQWVGKDVIRKSWDPFLKHSIYECNPQSIGM